MKRASSIIVFAGMFLLMPACGAPSADSPLAPADTVAPTASVPITPGPVPAGQDATEGPTDTPTLVSSETQAASTHPAPEPAATAVPTATTLPSPTPAPPAQPTASGSPTSESKPGPTPDPSMVQADIVDFILPDLNISSGATVIWTNRDEQGHTATSGKDGISASFDGIGWDSSGLDLGESFSMTFSQPGVFAYTCRFHPWMNATVTVEASSNGRTPGGGGTSGGGESGY